jgi:hypothetical protein
MTKIKPTLTRERFEQIRKYAEETQEIDEGRSIIVRYLFDLIPAAEAYLDGEETAEALDAALAENAKRRGW